MASETISSNAATGVIEGLIQKARDAMAAFEDADQGQVDAAVTALAWSIYEPGRARRLAEFAVEDTGLGNVESKVVKNQRKTFGCLRDLMRVKSVGIIEEVPERGLVKYAKPVGVVAAVTPSTNPAATPVNKSMFSLKGRNAVIVAPSPAGQRTTTETVGYMRAELEKVGAPLDLVQVLPAPVDKALTQELMERADLVVVTGSQNNVRRAYSSGRPAIGVGTGNVPVIIDSSADLADAAQKIMLSKCFDNATSCSSENSVTIIEDVYDDAVRALREAGGYLCSPEEKEMVRQALWIDGKLSRHLIAKGADVIARQVGLPPEAEKSRFFMVEEPCAVGRGHPFSNEKLSLVLTVYRAPDFAAAKAHAQAILDFVGAGHSVGIHTRDLAHARCLAEEMRVVRVLVNQAHTMGNGGGFDNGLNFTLSMGCGTWGGNSISDNLNYMHFLNITHLVTLIDEDKPSEEEMFGAYWSKYGR